MRNLLFGVALGVFLGVGWTVRLFPIAGLLLKVWVRLQLRSVLGV